MTLRYDLAIWASAVLLSGMVLLNSWGAFGAERYFVEVPMGPSAAGSLDDVQASVERAFPANAVLHKYHRTPHMAVESDEATLEGLRAQGVIVSYQPDLEVTTQLSTTNERIGVDRARGVGFDGSGRTVVVMDTGLEVDHPEFLDRVVEELCSASPDQCPNGLAFEVGAGAAVPNTFHGTHVCGICCGDSGVAPGVFIIAAKVFRLREGTATFGDINRAMEWVLDRYDAGDTSIVAINMSFSTGPRVGICDTVLPSTTALMEQARARGIVPVAAAGNSASVGAGIPACISHVLSVGCVDNSDAICGFSNGKVDVLAPGSGVESACLGGTTCKASGTSMSCPQMTGVVALTDAPIDGPLMLDTRNGLTTPRVHLVTMLDLQPPAERPVPCIACFDGPGCEPCECEPCEECPECPPSPGTCVSQADCMDNLTCQGAERCLGPNGTDCKVNEVCFCSPALVSPCPFGSTCREGRDGDGANAGCMSCSAFLGNDPNAPMCVDEKSLSEFCSGFETTTRKDLRECRRADWGNDEPATWRPRDCNARRRGDPCEPR